MSNAPPPGWDKGTKVKPSGWDSGTRTHALSAVDVTPASGEYAPVPEPEPYYITYVDPVTGKDIKVWGDDQSKRRYEGRMPGLLPVGTVPPGAARKYPGPVASGALGFAQGASWNMADDALEYPTGKTGVFQDQVEGARRENPWAFGVPNFLGSLLAPNPLRALSPVAGAARARTIGPVAPSSAVNLAQEVTGPGVLMNIPNRGAAMLAQGVKAGGYSAAANLGQQPVGEKDLGQAALAGAEGTGLSLGLQTAGLLPVVGSVVPGNTGGGRLVQTPAVQQTASTHPFLRPEAIRKPSGWGLLLPWKQADWLATRGNPESLLDEAGDAAVSASRASPGVLQDVISSRLESSATPTELGRRLVSYKVPGPLLSPPSTRAGQWVADLRARYPWTKSFLGTGEVPLLPAGSKAAQASGVYGAAVGRANQVIDEVDRAAPPMSVDPVLANARRAAVSSLPPRYGSTSQISDTLGLIDNAEASYPVTIDWSKVAARHPLPDGAGYAAVPGVATPAQLGRAGYSQGVVQDVQRTTGARGPVMETIQVAGPTASIPLSGTPAAPVPGPTVQVPVPESAKWTVSGGAPGASSVAGPRGVPKPPVATRVAHRNDVPDSIPQTLPGTTPGVPASGGVLVRPSSENVTRPVSPQPVLGVSYPVKAPTMAPVGEVRTELGHGMRKYADYSGAEQVPLTNAHAAARVQTSIGRDIDAHLEATLSPVELARYRAAKELSTVAHTGADLTDRGALKASTAAPRSLDSTLRGAFAGYVAGQAGGPAASIAGRNAAGALDRASDINPAKMWALTRRAEGIKGQGIDPFRQAQGALIRAGQTVPGAANQAIVQGVEEDGPLMSMPDDPKVGPWQNVVNKFLLNLKR